MFDRGWKLAIATVVVLSMAVTTAAAEPLFDQLDNGEFEEFEDDDPVDWRVLDGNANPTSDADEGERAVLINYVATEPRAGIGQNLSAENGDAPIVPNGEYELAFAANLATGQATRVNQPPRRRESSSGRTPAGRR